MEIFYIQAIFTRWRVQVFNCLPFTTMVDFSVLGTPCEPMCDSDYENKCQLSNEYGKEVKHYLR